MHTFNRDSDSDNYEERDARSLSFFMEKRFLENRQIFLWGEIDDRVAKTTTEKLLYLENQNAGEEIAFYINTPGGSITAGMAVYDTMQLITSPIKMMVTGMAASMGSILLCAGEKGKRLLYPHARVLIHQPLITGRMMGAAVDINIQAQEMERLRQELNGILAQASGQPIKKIEEDTDRDFYMNTEEAIQYGLADAVVEQGSIG